MEAEYSLAFIPVVLISLSVCLFYMMRIYHRNEWLNRRWRSQAPTDPLTLLPNFCVLEQAPEQEADKSFCCLRIDNLEFMSRHYGLMMRVHRIRSICRTLLPLTQEDEKLY